MFSKSLSQDMLCVVLVWLGHCAKSDGAQDILLALCSVLSPGAPGTLCGVWGSEQVQLHVIQALSPVLSLWSLGWEASSPPPGSTGKQAVPRLGSEHSSCPEMVGGVQLMIPEPSPVP